MVRRAAGGQGGELSASWLPPSSLPPDSHHVYIDTPQLIPSPLPFSYQVLLGGRDRDFYTHGASVTQAIRAGFAERNHPKTDASDGLRLDLTLQLNMQLSKWQLLLLQAAADAGGGDQERPDNQQQQQLLLLSPGAAPASSDDDEKGYADRYPPAARKADPALDEALAVLEGAQQMLEGGDGEVDRAAVVEMYRRSLALCPTADAHTYLGYMLSYDGAFEVRVWYGCVRESGRVIES